MFSTLRTRFGIPGVISVIALVFAMLGGAYAASDSSDGGKATASAKAKRGPKGPKGPKGATGPAGPAGPQGPAGANGKDGSNGANGTNGTSGAPGKSVSVTEIETGEPDCEERGGVEVKQEGAGSGIEVCNGKEGSAWVAGTAPSGAVLKGTWSVGPYDAAAAGESLFASFATGVPIDTSAPVNGFVLQKGENLPGQSTAEREELEAFCQGSAENPLPPTPELVGFGFRICIYAQGGPQGTKNLQPVGTPLKETGGGTMTQFWTTGPGIAVGYGSWALVAP